LSHFVVRVENQLQDPVAIGKDTLKIGSNQEPVHEHAAAHGVLDVITDGSAARCFSEGMLMNP
jgi:hypothetical protein